MISSKPLITFLLILGLFLFGAFTVFFFVAEINKKHLPVISVVQDFSLVNETNEPFTLSNLQGKVWIANFFFTTCGDICPILSRNMAAFDRTFEGVNNVRLVSISVNPEYDSASVLATYAQKHNANENWVFLTGKRETIKELAVTSFKLGSIEEPVFHSSYFSLVDQNGYIRGYYDGTDKDDINRLYRDATFLIKNNPS